MMQWQVLSESLCALPVRTEALLDASRSSSNDWEASSNLNPGALKLVVEQQMLKGTWGQAVGQERDEQLGDHKLEA